MRREIQPDGSAHYTLTPEETKKAIDAGIIVVDKSAKQKYYTGYIAAGSDRIKEIEDDFERAGIPLPWRN